MRSKIVVVKQHHEVLYAWAELRRRLDAPPAVWSLDTHTDTMLSFRGEANPPQKGDWAAATTVDRAVQTLRHDEHFDWALRSGTISRASILALLPGNLPPAHPGMTVRTPPDLPDTAVILNNAELFRPYAEKMLTSDFLRRSFGNDLPEDDNFILDIDCDYVYCADALSESDKELLHSLAERALLITLSEENEWVKILKLPGEKITGTSIAENLKKLLS